MTLKLATALMAGAALVGCVSTTEMDEEGMQTSASSDTTMASDMSTMPANTTTRTTTTTTSRTSMPANPMVGGAAMMANKTIVENASAAPNLTTLVAGVKAADLVGTLSGPGPFTVFAPTNDAFNRLPAGVLDSLLKPEMKGTLDKVLKYHVVAGRLTAKDLNARLKAGNGRTMLTTVAGEMLTLSVGPNNSIKIDGMNGSEGYVTTPDVMQSNGVVHVINGVLVPSS